MSFLDDLERHRNTERVPIKDQITSWAILSAIAVAGFTGKMILDNMFHRTVGTYMSKLTIPTFIISTAVAGGYVASDMIDPDKGVNRFTDSLLDPVGTARVTAALGIHAVQDHLVTPQIGTGQPALVAQYYDDALYAHALISRFI